MSEMVFPSPLLGVCFRGLISKEPYGRSLFFGKVFMEGRAAELTIRMSREEESRATQSVTTIVIPLVHCCLCK